MTQILYIEDEQEIALWLQRALKQQGFTVYHYKSYEAYEESGHILTPDIVILDIMLPGLDGFSIARKLKREYHDLPILMLSARSMLDDKLEGLSIADDYVTKPFQVEEILARVQVLLRRFHKIDEVLTIQHIAIHTKDLTVFDQEHQREILLTQTQYGLLRYFIEHLNQILTKEQLYEGVWQEPYIDGDKTLMVHIRYLREKIERDASNPTIIETVRGIGYRVKA
ncbi:DNA-binding response regulator [Lysinibacillus alkalisoli]|uniref:DNA-binding response regulator n=1 Tax=Lysinibacillus alkalisoli TaxID=1911548 RepID=A0A917LJE0_9BACI|nr:response regulator transcription factor [Lysinibacillus alkalisoli]GGG30612.1 DNA-binding response regulator [Lysinibacillus alkalisoli]